ncbi:NADH dehydrogenase (ubiquinone) B14.5 B subunit [Arctopsyche grandis]|uniref:NADH dehydrogenase (ubiquinone) B14.5 B subunit n=1 Tax=Arctopsyche grandis TaxID=121162 RepID=UPI00406D67C4
MSGKSALELLERDPDRIEPYINKYYGAAIGSFMGVLTGISANLIRTRPIFSGIQKHIGLAIIGAVALQSLNVYRDGYYAERDAVFRHYIELHPEDFVMPERKKYSEVLDSWFPIR